MSAAYWTPADLADLLLDVWVTDTGDDPIPPHVVRAWIALERSRDVHDHALAVLDDEYRHRLIEAKLATVVAFMAGGS